MKDNGSLEEGTMVELRFVILDSGYKCESQASSWVEAWNSACLSSCPRGERPLVQARDFPGGPMSNELPIQGAWFNSWSGN